MTWTIKIIKQNINTSSLTWNGLSWDKVLSGTYDYVINHNKEIESTWRRVVYSRTGEIQTNRESIGTQKVLTAVDAEYNFFIPTTQDVDVILPEVPLIGVNYFIKNLTTTLQDYKLHIKEDIGGDDILVLDSVFTTAFFSFDGIVWQGIYG